LVRPTVHEQPDDQVRLPIVGYCFGVDAFHLKDRNPLKQSAQCLSSPNFCIFHRTLVFQHALKISHFLKLIDVTSPIKPFSASAETGFNIEDSWFDIHPRMSR